MIQVKDVLDRARPLAVAGTFLAVLGLTAIAPWQSVHAEALSDRSLLTTSSVPSDLSTSTDAGDPQNGNAVGHTYSFTAGTAATITSITFEAWDSAFGYLDENGDYTPGDAAGTAPTGFSAAGVASQTITSTINGSASASLTGASVSANTWSVSGSLTLAAGDEVVLTFPNVFVNPDSDYEDNAFGQGTYFVHIRTLAGATLQDSGTVTSAVTPSIDITTRVQETLRFSVEGAEATDNSEGSFAIGSPTTASTTCEPLGTSGASTSISIGDTNKALAPNRAYFGGSYFRLATNSASGAIVYYSGATLKSGTSLNIEQIGTTPAPSTPGTEQFGLAVANVTGTSPSVTADSDYVLANGFAFEAFNLTPGAGETDAPVRFASSPGVVDCDTGEVRYVANQSGDTEAGIYTTRINYIASPSY